MPQPCDSELSSTMLSTRTAIHLEGERIAEQRIFHDQGRSIDTMYYDTHSEGGTFSDLLITPAFKAKRCNYSNICAFSKHMCDLDGENESHMAESVSARNKHGREQSNRGSAFSHILFAIMCAGHWTGRPPCGGSAELMQLVKNNWCMLQTPHQTFEIKELSRHRKCELRRQKELV